MNRRCRTRSLVMTAVLLASVAVAVPAAAADAPLPPEPDCADATTAVLVDVSSEPDLYAAYLLAGVLDTGCIVDAGDRNGPLPEASAALLEGLTTGYVVGGVVAVPAAKLAADVSWRRAGGVDRWATLDIIGGAAADPTPLPSAQDTPDTTGDATATPDCDGETTATLVDASAEPDLYAAYLLAGVLETGCIVDAGDRNGPLPDASAALLNAIDNGYAVGGETAVPPAKLQAGITWRRAGGADRWATLDIIGRAAKNPETLPRAVAAPPRTDTATGVTVSGGCVHTRDFDSLDYMGFDNRIETRQVDDAFGGADCVWTFDNNTSSDVRVSFGVLPAVADLGDEPAYRWRKHHPPGAIVPDEFDTYEHSDAAGDGISGAGAFGEGYVIPPGTTTLSVDFYFYDNWSIFGDDPPDGNPYHYYEHWSAVRQEGTYDYQNSSSDSLGQHNATLLVRCAYWTDTTIERINGFGDIAHGDKLTPCNQNFTDPLTATRPTAAPTR